MTFIISRIFKLLLVVDIKVVITFLMRNFLKFRKIMIFRRLWTFLKIFFNHCVINSLLATNEMVQSKIILEYDKNSYGSNLGTALNWGAWWGWSLTLYCSMRNAGQMAIGKTHPPFKTFYFNQIWIFVDDTCWRRNVLATTKRCWWRFWPILSLKSSFLEKPRVSSWYYQHSKDVINIEILSSTSKIRHHHKGTNIDLSPTSMYYGIKFTL